jgi:myosin heavy subunit
MREVYETEVNSKESRSNGAKSTRQKTVGAQCKGQMNLLIHRVESTELHYIAV